MKVLVAVPLVLLALLGAAGMSSLVDDDFCGTFPATFPEGSGSRAEIALAPPGERCIYTAPNGDEETTASGSWPWFFVALAGEALVAAWYLRHRTRPSRIAFASTVALAVAGAVGFYTSWQGAFFMGFVLSLPVGWLAGGHRPASALAAGTAVFLTACFTLWFGDGSAVIGCFVAVALTTAVAGAARAARLRPAR